MIYYMKSGVLYIDSKYNILQASRFSAIIAGYKEPSDIVGKKFHEVFLEKKGTKRDSFVYKILNGKKCNNGEFITLSNCKTYFVKAMKDVDKQGNIIGVVVTLDDVTSTISEFNVIKDIAYFDELTKLHNRNSLYKIIDNRIDLEYKNWALVLIDVDDFKTINDKSGHDLGDKLLKAFAQNLSNQISNKGIVGRLGGDEFILILDGNKDKIEKTIIQLYKNLEEPIQFEWNNIFITCSMGISLYGIDANNRRDLLKFADLALYHSKNCGKNIHTFYNEEINERFIRKQKIIYTLRDTINGKNSLDIFYQPIVDITNGKIKKVEALSRIEDEQSKGIFISEFISVAEETGLIIELGDIIFEKVCKQMHDWNNEGCSDFVVSINLSIVQLKNKYLVNRIKKITDKYNIDKRRINLEITETAFLDNLDLIKAPLSELYDMGYTFSVDDLGSGYSSFDYIVNLPINIIKIDKDYINKLDNRDVVAFLKMIKYFSKLTKKQVIIEGVERVDQYDKLKDLGFKFIQGYYFYRPMNKVKIRKLLLD